MGRTILITGVSSGLGQAIAEALLDRDHLVVGTVRQEDARVRFELTRPGRSIGRILDLRDTAAIATLVRSVEEEHGAIDVLVNNAGYGHMGVLEELEPDELRAQLEVNVVAPAALIRAVLPRMRARRRGHVVDIGSMGGVVAFPGLGAYHASKFALNGIGDALAAEVAPFGLKVTTVQPGVFRSDWGDRSLRRSARQVSDYDAVFDPARRAPFRRGDPSALGRVVAELVESEDPPLHLPVGPTAIRLVREKLAALSAEIDRWEALAEAGGEG